MSEEDLGKGLREIMEYHMDKLREKLDVFTTLAITEQDGQNDMMRLPKFIDL